MNILVYKFRPIILSLLEFTLECIATIYMEWGSCPTGGTIVDGKFWYTTTLEGDPDEMYIVVWEDDVNYPDLPYMLYLEVQTPPTDLTAWYEPQQVFKTFVLDGVSITVGVWMYNNLGDDTKRYSFRIFNGTTLVYSDDSLSLGHDGWASLNSDFIWISEAGVINLLYSFQENAHVTATRKAYYYNYQSTDGGLTWTSYLIHSHTNTWNSGYSEGLLYITGEGNTLYAELGRKLLFKSTDGGQNWTLVRNDLFPYDYADYDYLSHLFLFKGNLYKCFITEPNTYGVYKSTDGGYNFTYYPIVSLWPVCSDFAIVGDYVYMAFVSSYTFYYYRSADGETWELVSSDTQSYMRSDRPAFLAVSGDLVAFTSYYMAHRPGGGSTGISARSMITSRDGGLTWDILTTGFADQYYPKGMVRLTWTAPAGSQIEVYRRYNLPDFIGDWTLIDTVPAASSPYTDITSWCEKPNEYKLKIVDGAELGTAFIHTLDAQYYYVVNQITINDGSVYSLSWLKYVTPLRYPSLPITLAHPRLFLILQDGVEYEKIIYHASQSASVYPTLQFNPTVMMMVGYVPFLASIYWLIDGNWQISEIPLRGTSAEYSYYNSTVVRNFTARENGEAVVVLGNYKMTATVASYLDVYYTSDFGQSWTGPIAIWSLSGYAEQPRGDVFKTDDAYYILRWNSSHTDGSVYKSADGITWIGVLYFVSSVSSTAALATESDNFYFAVSVSNIAKLFKEIVGTSSQLTGLNTGSIAVKVSPTYASDSTIMAGISGAMKKSTDGGDTWITINTGLGSPYVYDIGMSNNFASDQTAFAVENAASIAKTTDGVSWTRYTSGITGSLNKVRVSPNFSSDNTVFGMCTDYIKHIYKSTDGGVNWSRSDTGIPASTNWIYCMDISSNFASDGTLFAGGTMDPTTAAMYRTTDGGANWTLKNTGLGTGGYIRLLKISPNYAIDQTVYCGKDTSYGLYKTTDSGNNWSLVYTFEANITSIEISPNFATDNTLYVTTSNYTWKSTDAGVSWVIISIAFNCSLRYLTVAPSSPVFHGSTLGVFKYTGTLGTCYELINAAISGLGTIYSMCVIGDYINIAGVSQPGGVFVMMHSSDGGLNFSSTLMQHMNFSYYADFSVDGSNITYGGRSASYNTGTPLFISYPGYAISHDYGATWEEVYIDYTHPHDEDEHMIEKIYYF